MKQTAVEWLENELKKIPFINPKEAFEQAKEMEKEQISKFVTINIESATGQDLGKVTYIPLPNIDYVPKQETLEEAAENYNDDFQIKGGSKAPHIKNVHIMNHFIAGAKWQQERSYSEEDPRADLKFIIFHRPTNTEIQMPVLSICDEYSTVSFSTSENDYEGKYNGINRLPSYVGNNSSDDYDVFVEINGVRHLYDGIFYSDYREVRRHGA